MSHEKANLALVAVFLAATVAILAGLAVVPALQEAQAANCSDTAQAKNRGAQGDIASKGKRQGGVHEAPNAHACP